VRKKFKWDSSKESDQNFLNRVIKEVFNSRGEQDVFIRSINAIIYEATGDKHYADLMTRLVMVITGNGIGMYEKRKEGKQPSEIFAEFVCDIFNNRYLFYLEGEIGGRKIAKDEKT